MSNYEDDEALFDDIYSGDQPKKVENTSSSKIDTTTAVENSGNSESTTVTNDNNVDVANNNNNNTSNTTTTINTSDNINQSNDTGNSTVPGSESTGQVSLQPSNNDNSQTNPTSLTGSEPPQLNAATNMQSPNQAQVPAEYLQQYQQYQMMQQQNPQAQIPGQIPGQIPVQMPGMGMVNMQMPNMQMPGMQMQMPQQLTQLQQYQQYQAQNQNQNQLAHVNNANDNSNNNATEPSTEHIPDITEIEVPTGYTDTVKADLANKDVGKLFIGGLNWETDEDRLKQYFSKYGEVIEINVMRDGATGKSRGFAFLTFTTGDSVDAVLKEKHILDGKLIDPKRAIPKDEQEKVGKVFVGGIAADVTPEEFRSYFEKFGSIIDSQLMINKDTGKSRGYGFVTYDSAEAVERVTRNNYVMFHGKKMEIKKAQPRTQHVKNTQAKAFDGNQNGNNNNGYNMMNNNGNTNSGYNMMNGYGDMSQYWQQMQQMQQMQQYWMMQQQQQQSSQTNSQQNQESQQSQQMSPNSQEAQINMYSNENHNGNNNEDDDVPNPQERGGRDSDYNDEDRPNLPSGPRKFREKGSDYGRSHNGGGSRYNDRRSGGGGGRRGGKYRGNNRRGNYHPYRR